MYGLEEERIIALFMEQQWSETTGEQQGLKYQDANIRQEILRATKEMGFEVMTPIQEQAIPILLEGKDIIGQAQTGTGKTAAFAIPMIQRIDPEVRRPQGIILCPTRELAIQAAEEIRKLADDSNKAAGEIKNNVAVISAQTASSVESAKEAESMVAIQEQAVSQVIEVFEGMNNQIKTLFTNLKEIAENAESVDKDRNDTLDAVENISAIIEETASGSALVREMANELLSSVDKLSQTAQNLNEDMDGLKAEIAVFKIN